MSGFTLQNIHGAWVRIQALDSIATSSPLTVETWRDTSLCILGAFLFMMGASWFLVPRIIALEDWKWRTAKKIQGSGSITRISGSLFGRDEK